MALQIPAPLAANCCKTPERAAWLDQLPYVLCSLTREWALPPREPFDGDGGGCGGGAPASPAVGRSAVRSELQGGKGLGARGGAWVVSDPKAFVGDTAFDATQHLFNCEARLRSDPFEAVRRMADLLGLDAERVRLWMVARAAAEPRED